MSRWRHSICDRCWAEREPGREPPFAMKEPDPEPCCFCGDETRSGIYVREDPANVEHCPDADACAVCGATRSKNDGSPITWRCRTCDRLVCHECTLTIPGSTPVEYYERTLCSVKCWERAGSPED